MTNVAAMKAMSDQQLMFVMKHCVRRLRRKQQFNVWSPKFTAASDELTDRRGARGE